MLEDLGILLFLPLGVMALFGWALWRTIKVKIGQSFKVQAVESALQKAGIKTVNAKFLNELNENGLKNVMTLAYNVMQWEKANNPFGLLGGGSKSLQELAALQQITAMGQARANVQPPE